MSALALILSLSLSQGDPRAPPEAVPAKPGVDATQPAVVEPAAALFELPAWVKAVTLHGAVDVYVAHNFNSPADHANFVPGTGTTAKRSDEVSLNLASIEVVLDPKPVGFHLWLAAGTGAEVVHMAEPVGENVGPQVWKIVQKASISATIPIGRGLLIEGGIYPSHIGFESLPSQASWNYTRSWLGEFSPYYQTGVKAAYGFTDNFSAQLHVINGWQTIADNNQSGAVGSQLALSFERFSIAFNTFAGPEGANDNVHWRFFGDLVIQATIFEWFKVGLAADLGVQQTAGAGSSMFHGVTGYARFQFERRLALALRGEYYADPGAVISGAGQTLVEGTATLEYKPWEMLMLKLEGRHDRSTAAVFSDASGGKVNTQTLVVLGAVAYF